MERPKVLLMYSGGKDSLLSALKLINQGYKVYLITFDNGRMLPSIDKENKRLRGLEINYGKERIEYLGVLSNLATFRHNDAATSSNLFSEIIAEYGDISPQSLNCLNCKSSMYCEAIIYCLEHGINAIAEGARKSKKSPLQQVEVIEEFRNFLAVFGIELLLPVYDMDNDWSIDNEIMLANLMPKSREWTCLSNLFEHSTKIPSEEETQTAQKILQKTLLPRMNNYIKNGFDGSGRPKQCEPSQNCERIKFE